MPSLTGKSRLVCNLRHNVHHKLVLVIPSYLPPHLLMLILRDLQSLKNKEINLRNITPAAVPTPLIPRKHHHLLSLSQPVRMVHLIMNLKAVGPNYPGLMFPTMRNKQPQRPLRWHLRPMPLLNILLRTIPHRLFLLI